MALVCQGQPTNVPPSGIALHSRYHISRVPRPSSAWAGFLVFQIEQDQLGRLLEGTLGKRAATNEPCILGDKDAILTALGNTAQSETLVVVASTDEHGATVVEKRIREQLERSERLRHNCAFKVNSVGLRPCPPPRLL